LARFRAERFSIKCWPQYGEVRWAKFTWIGSPERWKQLYMRADSPYKTLEIIRRR
jgi:hypothetical protein